MCHNFGETIKGNNKLFFVLYFCGWEREKGRGKVMQWLNTSLHWLCNMQSIPDFMRVVSFWRVVEFLFAGVHTFYNPGFVKVQVFFISEDSKKSSQQEASEESPTKYQIAREVYVNSLLLLPYGWCIHNWNHRLSIQPQCLRNTDPIEASVVYQLLFIAWLLANTYLVSVLTYEWRNLKEGGWGRMTSQTYEYRFLQRLR